MKNEQMSIRIPKDLKDKFYAICREEYINPSALLRGWIEDFIETRHKAEPDLWKAGSLPDLFTSTEEIIKENLAAQAVKMKLDSINREGNLYFSCIVQIDESTYYKATNLALVWLFLNGPQYIESELKRLDDIWEIEKTKWLLERDVT